ncbi:hypothetical protein RCO28_34495 [Streptomyces sp. LHD-70]|uniref:hypothetical protein n=1 Tax=Streptomyces sp. LHD-70 TaxID=3072140 RepID=UPI00280EEB9C|nr:hypothetical protein [Streptomyces sp. LHD-70]MDQ8707543.1 hypothetical protein [Streptomyces sp. LHD-70]
MSENAAALPPMGETWARAIESEPSVTITEETFFGHGWQPLTIAVLQALWFMPPGMEFDVPELVGWFKKLGWKSANGKPLGEDAVRRELALIKKAGYVKAYRVRLESGHLGGSRYEISKRPRQPQEQIEYISADSAKPQVTPNAFIGGTRQSPDASNEENRRSGLMPPITRSGESPRQVDGAKPQVTPDASNHGFPPTPPLGEEEDSSSPNPSPATAGASDRRVDDAAVSAAAEFLLELPGEWACGLKSAGRLAPRLAEACRLQGWDLGPDLVTHLTKRSRKQPMTALRERVADLPRFKAARARVPGQPRQLPLSEPEAVDIPVLSDGVEVDPVVVKKARALLLTLTGSWALGPETADRLAPALAAKALERGWDFDEALRTQLMTNPGGVHNYELILETHRIGRLPYRQKPVRQAAPGDTSPRQAAIDACSRCDEYGQYEIDGRVAVCRHEDTSRATSDAAPAKVDARPDPSLRGQAGASTLSGPELMARVRAELSA